MIFKYTDFTDGLYQIQFKKSVKDLGIEVPFIGDVIVDCKIDKSVRQIVLSCEAECDAQFTCDRCNDNFEETLILEFSLIKVFNLSTAAPDNSSTEYLPADVKEIDISHDLKEFMYLSIPMKKLCSDDCMGLCMRCGANLNYEKCSCQVDEIIPVLKKLKNNLDN